MKKNKSTIKQSSKQHAPIGQIYQKSPTAMSHLNNACAILSDCHYVTQMLMPEMHLVVQSSNVILMSIDYSDC